MEAPHQEATHYPMITSDNGSKQPMFLGVTCTLLFLSSCVVSARFYCRAIYTKKFGLDDYSIAVALAVAISLGVMNGFHISYGAGTHPIGYLDNPALAYIPNLKHWYAYQMVYPLSLALVKASFLALYHRVFPPPNINRYLFWGTSAFIAVYTIVIIFVNAFECPKSPSDAWKASFPRHSPQCNDVPTVYYTMAAINILTDMFVLILPIRPALSLNINRKKKIAIVGIFLIGSVAVFASCLRAFFLYKYFISMDPAFDTIEVLLWSQVELNVAIICSSIASLRPLFQFAFRGSGSTSNNKYTRTRSRNRLTGSDDIELASNSKSGRERASTKIEAQLHSMDNESQELIWGGGKEDGIKRTVEMSVTSEAVEMERRVVRV